jgi:hypothetical protein
MTTYTLLGVTLPFQFTVTLDGSSYSVNVSWNITGQRPYVNVYNGSNALVVTTPLIGSPDGYDINLVGGYFKTSTMVFRNSTQQFEVSP